MRKYLMTLTYGRACLIAAVLCCAMTITVFTACTDNDDNQTAPKILEGTWIGDLTGKTFSLWN